MRVAVHRAGPARLLVAVGMLLLPTACSESDAERRADYCEAVEEVGPQLTRISDEGGPAAFLEALPVLEDLAAESPDDLRDEWKTFLDALRGLRDAVEETGLDPADVTGGGLPDDLSREDRRRLRAQASVLARPEVESATRGIEQHALDTCQIPLL